ncbi:hypothetical protein [Candidatus Parabeggiatoa sp. HSG14]|uniref:hypothetical protein n=1 Tax=Candidatus Parabeggiatoa sp. HSG14 TaxID=3055593 RepID=UPI0025A717BB|nr:hypothetical protein [Thiotrichales bacterium HSG14]
MDYTLGNESLELFLRRKNKESESKRKTIDWEEKKQQWLAWVDKLYGEINDWLNPLRHDGIVKINYENTTLKEDYLGSYPVKSMTIIVGTEYVSLKPKGVVLVNSWGRVDMMGDDGSIMFILIETKDDISVTNQPKLQWHIAVRTPEMKYWKLTKDSFTDALKQVMQK